MALLRLISAIFYTFWVELVKMLLIEIFGVKCLKMKLFPFFLFLSILGKSQITFIHGKLQNYKSETIYFFKKDYTTFTNRNIDAQKFDKEYYEISFENSKPQLYKLFLNWVYIEPGDSIQFNFSIIDVPPDKIIDSISAFGKFPGNYTYYYFNKKNSAEWIGNRPKYDQDIANPEESFYQSLKHFYFNEYKKKIDSFSKKNPISQNFREYLIDELHVKFLADLLQTFKNHNVQLSSKLRKEIEHEVDAAHVNDERMIDALDYVNFAYLYLEYFLPKENIATKTIENYLSLGKSINNKFTGVCLDFWKSLLVRSQYFNKPAFYNKVEDSLTNVLLASIKDDSIVNSLTSFLFTYSNRNEKEVKKVELVDVHNQTSLFGEILEKDSSSIKIVDFWASWCVPCIEESRRLDEITKENKGIKVIKISVDKNDSSWKKAIEKFKYNPENHFLIKNERESRLIDSLINLESIPRFLIVTRKGHIAFFQAFPPSDKRNFLSQIELAGRMDTQFVEISPVNASGGL